MRGWQPLVRAGGRHWSHLVDLRQACRLACGVASGLRTIGRTFMQALLFSGIFDLSWWGVALVARALTHVTIVSVTVCLHRHQAHFALALHPVAGGVLATSAPIRLSLGGCGRAHSSHTE